MIVSADKRGAQWTGDILVPAQLHNPVMRMEGDKFNAFRVESIGNEFCHFHCSAPCNLQIRHLQATRTTCAGNTGVLFSNSKTFEIGSGPSRSIDFAIRHQEVHQCGGHDASAGCIASDASPAVKCNNYYYQDRTVSQCGRMHSGVGVGAGL